MSYALAQNNGWTVVPTTLNLCGPNNTALDVTGTVTLNTRVSIGRITKEKRHKWLVTKNLAVPMLLGADLISDFDIIPDQRRKRISFFQKSGFRVLKSTTIPPRSEMMVATTVNENGTLVTVPFETGINLLVANCVINSEHGESSILITNPTDKAIDLEAGFKLADYELLESQNNLGDTVIINNISIPIENSSEVIKIGSNLIDDQLDQLKALLKKHRSAFSLNGELGCSRDHEHDIKLIDNVKPIVEPTRRHPRLHAEEAERQVKDMLSKKIIEHSTSPWSSQYVIVKKKTNDFRVCIDFRKLNDITKKDAYPLPNIETCLENIAGNQYYSSFDMAAGYWQMPLSEDSKEYTAFRTESGHYQFIRMPFGLCNAPASFQRMMNAYLCGLKGLSMQVYLDDVCLASQSWPEHLELLDKFFEIITKSNLKLKASKCVLASKSIKFLGHEVSANGISQDKDKIKALELLPRPTNISELRRVIGLLSYYRKFVPNFATLAHPLTCLLRKQNRFNWSSEQEESLNEIIKLLKQNAVLTYFNSYDPVALKTDASKIGIGGILMQKQSDVWRIVSCYSRKLNDCERNYGVTDMEGLAVVECMKKFRPYLLGRRFDLIVDHCALCILRRKLSSSPRLRRWSLLLQEFDFNVIYQKGQLHNDVDCLSRAPVTDDNDFTLDEKILTLFVPLDIDDWVNEYTDEESLLLLREAVESKNNLSVVDDLIYFEEKLYVPESKRNIILKEAHSSLRGGHRGIAATGAKLTDLWWPTMNTDVSDYVKSCTECQARKIQRAKPYGAIQHFEAFEPFQTVCIDTFGPISESINGNRYIIVAVDSFTKFIEAAAIPDLKAPGCANFLLSYFSTFGTPDTVRTDNGPQFLNNLVDDTLKVFGVKHSWSTADHSQGNAIAERAIQTLQEALSLNCSSQLELDNWDSILPVTVLALNTTVSVSTGYTPFEMVFGRKCNILDNHLSRSATPKDVHTKLLKYKLDAIYSRAIENQTQAKQTSANYFNKNHRFVEFKVGDLVMIRSPNRRKGKMEAKFLGPFKVLSRDKAIYTIEEVATQKVLQRHIESLKPFRSQTSDMNEASNSNPSTSRTINCSFVTKPSKLTMLFNFIVLLSLILPSTCTIWTKEPPAMWQWADKTVYGRTSFYDVLMILKNPCDSLQLESHKFEHARIDTKLTAGPNITHPDLHTAMVERCEKVYETLWEEEMKIIVETCKGRLETERNDEFSGIDKRSWVTDLTVGAVTGSFFGPLGTIGGITAVLISDLVGIVWDHISPYSEESRLTNIESKIGEILLNKSHELNAFKNITKHSVRVLNSTLTVVERNEENINQLMLDLPEYIFGANGIMDFVQHNSRLLRRIRTSCRSNVETQALAELLQLPSLNDVKIIDSSWISITAHSNKAIRFIFKTVEPSKDSHVAKVTPFDIWDVSKVPAELISYSGPEYLIYNRSSACAKQIILPANHIVMDRCETPNFYSEPLKTWRTIKTSKNITAEPQITTVKYAGANTWVYCYPGKITINNRRMNCPVSVISLPAEANFNTSDYVYAPPKKRKSEKTNSLDVRLGAHFVHSPINDEHELMQQLEGFRAAAASIEEPGPLDPLPPHAQWAFLITYIPIFLIIGALITYILYKKEHLRETISDLTNATSNPTMLPMVSPSISSDVTFDSERPFV